MIDVWQAVLLALIQGLTEFLPISSSAHLLLPSLLLGWPDQGLAFDVAVHLGTLLAVLLYYRKDLLYLLMGGVEAARSQTANDSSREILFLAVATVPAVAVGFFLNTYMDSLRTLPVIIATTIGFALLLGYADLRKNSSASTPPLKRMSLGAALLIGCAQALAPIPGTSRSGITITAGLFLGLGRQAAARFSFLLSIPIILGAGLLKSLELLESTLPVDWRLLLIGVAVAAVSAYGCIALFIRMIDRIGMLPFVVYRIALGLFLLMLWWR